MEALGVLNALKEKPALRLMFSGGPPAPLTAESVTALFKVTFSVAGSSRRLVKERAVGHWRDWLIDIEGMHTLITRGKSGNVEHNAFFTLEQCKTDD